MTRYRRWPSMAAWRLLRQRFRYFALRHRDRKLTRREYADLEHFMLGGMHWKTLLQECSKCRLR